LNEYRYYFREGFNRGYQDGYYSRFRYGRNYNGAHCFIVQTIAKRADKYLFNGKVWIHAADFRSSRLRASPPKTHRFGSNALNSCGVTRMVGTARPRISMFMQRFRNLGLVEMSAEHFLIIKENKLTDYLVQVCGP
jgi:hypothetical protein